MKLTFKSRHFIFFLAVALLSSCEKFEFSPYAVDKDNMPTGVNAANLAQLTAYEDLDDDTVTILFTGDSQRFYDELEDLVAKANTIPSIDFVILSGDISDFGLLREFRWIHDRLEKLNRPYLCVIGNHDLTSRGSEVYINMFGEKNFSFTYKKYKFLFHDTNGLEYGFDGSVPHLPWLQNALNDSYPNWFIGVSHVPPYNQDFDPALEQPYVDLLGVNLRFILSLHGHQHDATDGFPYPGHVRYINSNAVIKREAMLLKLYQGHITKQMITY